MTNSNGSDWFIKLLWNLYGYSTILIPIGVIVYMVKHKYCLPAFSNLLIVRIIVYGKDISPNDGNDIEQAKLIGNGKKDVENGSGSAESEQMSKNKKLLLFVVCFLGLHTSYLIWGVFQEKIMTTEYSISPNRSEYLKNLNDPYYMKSLTNNTIKFQDSQFLVLINRIFAFIIASIVFVVTQTREQPASHNGIQLPRRFRLAPFHEFLYCSLSNILSSWCQYEALKFVNFPTQVLSKACKIPSVMVMSKLVSHKKYATFEYICSLLISVGMVLFLFGNHNTDPGYKSDSESNSTSKLINGLIVLTFYLAFDSFTSNWEEKIYHKYHISSWQMMAAVNLCSTTLTLTSLTEQGNLSPAFITITSSPLLLRDCILLSLSSTIGQFFVFFTISHFGALIFAMIMTLRQILAILLSFVIYGHSITLLSILGMLIVFTSIMSLRFMKISNKVKK